jgi:hypothetical protein
MTGDARKAVEAYTLTAIPGYVHVGRFVNAPIDVIGAGVNAHIVGGVEIEKIKASSGEMSRRGYQVPKDAQ